MGLGDSKKVRQSVYGEIVKHWNGHYTVRMYQGEIGSFQGYSTAVQWFEKKNREAERARDTARIAQRRAEDTKYGSW